MCTGLEIAALVGAGATTAGTAHQAYQQNKQEAPRGPQAEKKPDVNLLRRRATQGLQGGPAGGGTALTPPATGRSTLLGQ